MSSSIAQSFLGCLPAFHFISDVIDFLSDPLDFRPGLFFRSFLLSVQDDVFQVGGHSALVDFNHLQKLKYIYRLRTSIVASTETTQTLPDDLTVHVFLSLSHCSVSHPSTYVSWAAQAA